MRAAWVKLKEDDNVDTDSIQAAILLPGFLVTTRKDASLKKQWSRRALIAVSVTEYSTFFIIIRGRLNVLGVEGYLADA